MYAPEPMSSLYYDNVGRWWVRIDHHVYVMLPIWQECAWTDDDEYSSDQLTNYDLTYHGRYSHQFLRSC